MEDEKKFAVQMLGATFEFAKLAISSLIHLNAGAATALLVFIGNHSDIVAPANYALLLFAIGAGLGGASSILGYLGQRCDWEVTTGRRASNRLSDVLVGAAFVCVIIGYALFFAGCICVAMGIHHGPATSSLPRTVALNPALSSLAQSSRASSIDSPETPFGMALFVVFFKDAFAAIAGAGVGAWLGARFAFRSESMRAADERNRAANQAAIELAGRRANSGNLAIFVLSQIFNDLAVYEQQFLVPARRSAAP
jgi:hypothetical protein